MRGMPDAELRDLAATVAVARLVLGPEGRASRRRRTSSTPSTTLLLRAGIDDWGGVSPVTPDHVNPERPWPQIDELASGPAAAGFDAARAAHDLPGVRAAAASRGSTRGSPRTSPRWPTRDRPGRSRRASRRAARGRSRTAASRQRPHRPARRHRHRRPHRRPPRRLRHRLRRLGRGRRARSSRRGTPRRRGRDVAGRAAAGRRGPGRAARPGARGRGAGAVRRGRRRRWTSCAGIADDVRRDAVGDDVTYVVNRNINFTNVCYVGCRFCAFAQRERDADAYRLSVEQVADRAEEAWRGRRHRGVHAGRHRPEAAGHRVRRPGAGDQGAGAGHARARVLADGDRHRRGEGRRVRSATG